MIKKNPSASYPDLVRATGLPEHKVKVAANQLRRKGLIKEFGSEKRIAFTKPEVIPTLTDVSEWKSLITPLELFNALIEYVKITNQNILILRL
ncbi:MAG: hypothetical protein ACFFFH_17965 [Candidatus Thorarchaeota archaeon]